MVFRALNAVTTARVLRTASALVRAVLRRMSASLRPDRQRADVATHTTVAARATQRVGQLSVTRTSQMSGSTLSLLPVRQPQLPPSISRPFA